MHMQHGRPDLIPSKTHTESFLAPFTYKSRKPRMWANAQRDGRPAEYRWCLVLNAAKFG